LEEEGKAREEAGTEGDHFWMSVCVCVCMYVGGRRVRMRCCSRRP
jgi:hypothetical protein